MKHSKLPNKTKIIAAAVILLVGGGVVFAVTRAEKPAPIVETPSQKPRKAVNLIPQSERPYVTLEPLVSRNLLKLTIHDLKKFAASVEVTLEYDRNKGVLDAVVNSFNLAKIPLVEEMFLGSKSAGGHITYHDDVIGGTMTMSFTEEDYDLEVPWRYQDTEKSYSQLSTSDGRFQLSLTDPIKQTKVIVMESPGLPAKVDGDVVAGPYVITTVGKLPSTDAAVTIRTLEEFPSAKIVGWDGEAWKEYETAVDGKTVRATGALVGTYVVVDP